MTNYSKVLRGRSLEESKTPPWRGHGGLAGPTPKSEAIVDFFFRVVTLGRIRPAIQGDRKNISD